MGSFSGPHSPSDIMRTSVNIATRQCKTSCYKPVFSMKKKTGLKRPKTRLVQHTPSFLCLLLVRRKKTNEIDLILNVSINFITA